MQPSNCFLPDTIVLCSTGLPSIISTMGALSTFTLNEFPLPIQDIKTVAKLDFSGKQLKVEEASIIAELIPLNVSGPAGLSSNKCVCKPLTLFHIIRGR